MSHKVVQKYEELHFHFSCHRRFWFWSSHQREAEIGIKALQMEQKKSKLKLDITSPSLFHNGKKVHLGCQAVGDDGKKTFGSGQIDKLKNGTMYNNGVSIYRLAVTQKLCTTKAFFFKAKPRHSPLYEILVLGQLRGRVSSKLSLSSE